MPPEMRYWPRSSCAFEGPRKIKVNLNFDVRALHKIITSAFGSLKPSVHFKLLFHVPTFITGLNLPRCFQRVLSNLTTGRGRFVTRSRSKTRQNQNAEKYGWHCQSRSHFFESNLSLRVSGLANPSGMALKSSKSLFRDEIGHRVSQ